MTIALLGAGAMATYVQTACDALGIAIACRIVRPGKVDPKANPIEVSTVDDLPSGVTLLVDCAGHQGLADHGPRALRRGVDVLTVSIGALADLALERTLAQAAAEGDATLHLSSGAIGALDVLRAAGPDGLDRVHYLGRKPPAGWRGSPAEARLDLTKPLDGPTVHFAGSAREAALAYPKNANVAAAVALAGIGFDKTTVELIADPAAIGNTHEVAASGPFGTMRFSVTGHGLPDNPRTSALAAMSIVSALRDRQARIRF